MLSAEDMRDALNREYGYSLFDGNAAVGIRIPKRSLNNINEQDVIQILNRRDIILELVSDDTISIYLFADTDHINFETEKFIKEIFFEGKAPGDVLDMDYDGKDLEGVGSLKHGGEGRYSPGKKSDKGGVGAIMGALGEEEIQRIQEIMKGLSKRKSRLVATRMRSGRRMAVVTTGRRGRYVKYRRPEGKAKDLAIFPTIRSAIMHSDHGDIDIRESDFRDKVRRRKVSTLVCIVFDTSGSISSDERAWTAKMVTHALLMDAYQKRDRVALVTFSGQKGNLVLPFTSGIETANRMLQNIPYGGTTPLARGLVIGLESLKIEMVKVPDTPPILVLVTDGSANTPISVGANIRFEILRVCRMIRNAGIRSLIIDIDPDGSDLARSIADQTGGRYHHPGDATADTLLTGIKQEQYAATEIQDANPVPA